MKILLFTKPTFWGNIIINFIKQNFSNNLIITGDWGEKIPDIVYNWEGDYIISFLSPWILPQKILNKVKIAAINFHPSPPKYPGIGCYNYAIYDAVKEYGATCHHMLKQVDSGQIIAVKKFPLYGNETVLTLKEKTMTHLTELFYKIIDIILKEEDLPVSNENWERKAYTRKEFQEFCKLDLTMSEEELSKKLRAVYFPGALDYPNIEIKKNKFFLIKAQEYYEWRKKID